MTTDLSTVPVLDTSKIDSLLGVNSDYGIDTLEAGTFDQKEKDALGAIIQSGDPTGIETASATAEATSTLPEYLNGYKEILANKPATPESDTTNYSEKAIKDFGSEYSHINSRDSYEDELFVRTEKDKTLSEHPAYKVLLDISAGHIEKSALLRHNIKQKMEYEAKANYSLFSEEDYDNRVGKFFDESGKLNQQGEYIANEIISGYNSQLSDIQNQVKVSAQSELTKLRENRSALAEYTKSPKVDNIELGEELGLYIQEFVNSGKSRDWVEKDLPPKEAAEREALIAIIADPYLRAQFITKVDERGQKYGVNEIAKRKFNQ